MTTDDLEKKLDAYKRAYLLWLGAVLTLLAVAIADIPNSRAPYTMPGWYGVWFIAQAWTVFTALRLWFGPEFRKFPFSERIGTVFSYVFAGWIALVAFGVKWVMMFYPAADGGYWSYLGNVISAGAFWQMFLPIGGIGAVIGITYWLLKRKLVNSPEVMFP